MKKPIILFLNLSFIIFSIFSVENNNLQDFNILLQACFIGDCEEIESVIPNVNLNQQIEGGWTPLMVAVFQEHQKVVELLLSYKADPNIQSNDGITPLMVAADKGNEEIVKYLLIHCADPNTQDHKGERALVLAVVRGYKEIVEFLLQYKADPTVDRNVLRFAMMSGYKEIVELLLLYKADYNIRKENGATALISAIIDNDEEIVDFLLEYNADIELTLKTTGDTVLGMLNNINAYNFNLADKNLQELKLKIEGAYTLDKEGARNALAKYPLLKKLLIKRMLKQGIQLYTDKAIQQPLSNGLMDNKKLKYNEELEFINNNYLSELNSIYKDNYFKRQALNQGWFQEYAAREYCFNNLKKISNSSKFSDLEVYAYNN